MRSAVCLAVSALMLAVIGPAVRAQGQPAIPSVPTTTFTYQDSDGPGRLDLFDLGPDDATGGRVMRAEEPERIAMGKVSHEMVQKHSIKYTLDTFEAFYRGADSVPQTG